MPTHAEDKAPTKSGDLVRLDYELWAEGGGRTDLIDTTREAVAQDAKVPVPEGARWGPKPHLIGGDYFPGGIENALVGLKPGEEVDKEFAPADAFGERDPKLIELFSMHEISRLPEMRKPDAHLDVGTVLTVGGRRGRVVTLTAARVRVDFNPSFAGRKVRGKFKVVERVHEPVEQARAFVDLSYGRGPEFGIEVKDGTISLKIPERSKFDLNWFASKPKVVDLIRSHLKPKKIELTEEYVTPPAKEKSAEKAAESPPAETSSKSSAKGGHGSKAEPAGEKSSD